MPARRLPLRGLAEPGGHLGALLVVADADRARQAGSGRDDLADLFGQLDRVLDVGSDVGLVPAPHLDGVAEVAQQAHHLFGGFVVGGRVQRQENRVGAFACRRAQRHPGVHTEFARRIGRARDDLARLGGIAVAADDDRQAREFGVPPHLDRGLELVKVDVQDPSDGHVPQSLRATLSHLSPSSRVSRRGR